MYYWRTQANLSPFGLSVSACWPNLDLPLLLRLFDIPRVSETQVVAQGRFYCIWIIGRFSSQVSHQINEQLGSMTCNTGLGKFRKQKPDLCLAVQFWGHWHFVEWYPRFCTNYDVNETNETSQSRHRDPSMYTAYGPRGLYWNPASPVKLTWSELDRSNFACARSTVKSLVPLERKETQPFFVQVWKKSVKVCGYTSSAKFFGLLGKIVRSFVGDRAKRPMGMKARLARSLGGFCTSWTKESSLG